MARISQHSLSKKHGKGAGKKFEPDLNEWSEACRLYQFDKQIIKHFDICPETFYLLLDRERAAHEKGGKSVYLDAYVKKRNETRQKAVQRLMDLADNLDVGSAIFLAKTHGGMLETRDQKLIELKKKEVELKTKAFLSDLAAKFNLNSDQLEKFAKEYFKSENKDE